MDLWGKLLARSFPHTPFKNSRTTIIQINLLVCGRTDGARVNLAFAAASSHGPPRPWSLGKVFGCKTGCPGGHPLQDTIKGIASALSLLLYSFLCECFLEGVRGNPFSRKRFPRIISKITLSHKSTRRRKGEIQSTRRGCATRRACGCGARNRC